MAKEMQALQTGGKVAKCETHCVAKVVLSLKGILPARRQVRSISVSSSERGT